VVAGNENRDMCSELEKPSLLTHSRRPADSFLGSGREMFYMSREKSRFNKLA